MALKSSELTKAMIAAARESLESDWPKTRDYATGEMRRLAGSLSDIVKLVARKKVSKRQARALLRIHKNTAFTVLLTIEGLGVITVENAVNAALRAVADLVNGAAGFRLV